MRRVVRAHDDVASVEANSPSPTGRRRLVGLLAAVACVVAGSRLVIVSTFGSSVPVLDQWDAEGQALYSPYLRGTLSFANLLASHNGHRILITRLLALGHLELSGEWNTRLEMIFGAAVLTAVVTLLAALLVPLVGPQHRMLLSCFIALMFAFPLDFENTLWGFQSQMYLSLLLGLAAVVAFAAAQPFTLRWFGGLGAATLGYFTFATGLAALPAAGLLVALQLATGTRKRSGREVAAIVVMGVIALAMTLWGVQHTETKSTPWTFVQGLGAFAVLTMAGAIPIVLYCRHFLVTRREVSDRGWLIIGIAGWVGLQVVLFAYGRGIHIAPRYLDVVLLIYPVALVALFERADRPCTNEVGPSVSRGPRLWMFAVVLVTTVAGCVSVLACSYWSKASEQQMADVRAYLVTGNVDELRKTGNPNHGVTLAHPYPERQAQALDDSNIRAILPPEIRPGGADIAGARDRMLLRGRTAAASATAVDLILRSGPAFLALGVSLFFAAAMPRNPTGPCGARQ